MRLVIDEHYSPEIARQLRARGHVVCVAERSDLIQLRDDGIFELMARARRAILTNNARDFVPLAARAARAEDEHFGLLLTSDESMPRRREAIGLFVRVLDELLAANPAEDACRNQVRWLP